MQTVDKTIPKRSGCLHQLYLNRRLAKFSVIDGGVTNQLGPFDVLRLGALYDKPLK